MKIYLIALSIFFGIDMIWLGLVAKNFYASQIGHLMKPQINWGAALLFYLLFVVGLVVFAINPALEKESLKSAVLLGGFLGLLSYATYDLTNLATLKDWPILVTVIDLIWGTVLGGIVAGLTYLAITKLNG